MNRYNEKKKTIIKISYKLFMLVVAFLSASLLWYWNIAPEWGEGYNGYITLFCVGCLFCIIYWFLAKMYEAQKIGLYRLPELVYFQFLSFFIADVALYIESVFWFQGFEKLSLLSYLIVLIIQLFVIAGSTFVCNRLFARYDAPRKIAVIYGNDTYQDLLDAIHSKKYRYEVVACLRDDETIEKMKGIIDQCETTYLYEVDPSLRKELVLYCEANGKEIYLTQDIEELILRQFTVSHNFDIPFIRPRREEARWYYPSTKRVIDIVCSGIALVILSPVFLVVSIAIKAHDGGPVFYKQIRLTKGHREFKIYKFRSMIVDAEKNGARLASQNDDRITPIGKFIRMTRIDELPQLINILKGDMSIVGPRPERPEIEREYLKELPEFGLRLQVPAGLTGYAQVFGKYNTTPLNKLKLDLLYIKQRSLLLDFKIMFYTIKIVLVPESTEGVANVTNYTSEDINDIEKDG